MVDAIKRYAREVADLKVKLAEKDAQLMGGFGDMSRLKNMDDDLGIPMVVMPLSQVRVHREAVPALDWKCRL